MEKQTLTRQKLYELVWAEPILSLSKKFNISDVGLRKICIKMSIPLPKVGHWQKLRFGKKIQKPPLPDYDGDGEIKLSAKDENTPEIIEELSPLKQLQNEIESELQSKLIVPDRLTNPDKLVIAAKDELLNKSKRWLHNGLTNCSWQHLDINVSPDSISRSLRFFDTLIKAFRTRGYEVQVGTHTTHVTVQEDSFKISLRETTKRIITKEGNRDRTDYHPTGILCFQLRDYSLIKEWRDGKQLLEQQISKIIAQLEISGSKKRENRLHWAKQEEIRKEKERIQKEFEKRQEVELSQFNDMLNKASRWHKANNLRKYIDEIESKAIAKGDVNDELTVWLQWARRKADWYDPFVEGEDELLDDIDKEVLATNKKPSFYSW